jgi:hypothetical protein
MVPPRFPDNNSSKKSSHTNISMGNFSNSYYQRNLEGTNFIENEVIEKKAPSRNLCNKITLGLKTNK